MDPKPILIHTHFHRRRTGITRSIENVFSFFESKYESYIYGYGISGKKISWKKLSRLVFSRQYFVMHCHRNNEIFRALFLRVLGANFKLVATRHAESNPSGLTNFLLKRADEVVALTIGMQEKLKYPSKVVGHGVDNDLFRPKKGVKRVEVKQKYMLTCAGRVRKSKGQKVMLEVFAPILKEHSDWALVIVGKVDKPEFLVELKNIVATHKVEAQVYFIKETSEIISFYQASHSVIVPSFSEGFSLVCAEAMACGCNVIATRNVGVHSEIIQENKNGYLFDIDNKEALQNLLKDLCVGTLPHLGTAAQINIKEHWSAQIEADRLMAIYANIETYESSRLQ
jgi:glycosyltransferase involved in cell wall biosynthesis